MGDLISLIQRGRVLTEEGTQGENRFPCRRWGRLLGKAEETVLEWVPEEEAGVCQGDGMGTRQAEGTAEKMHCEQQVLSVFPRTSIPHIIQMVSCHRAVVCGK